MQLEYAGHVFVPDPEAATSDAVPSPFPQAVSDQSLEALHRLNDAAPPAKVAKPRSKRNPLGQLALRYLKTKNRATSLYKKADAILEKILVISLIGDVIALPDGGQKMIVVNNFAKGNTGFKAASFKRLDLKEVK